MNLRRTQFPISTAYVRAFRLPASILAGTFVRDLSARVAAP